MLTQQLRKLEADGIVNRRVYAMIPPGVEYSLTEYGLTLQSALEAMFERGRIDMERLDQSDASLSRSDLSADQVH